MDFLDPVKVKEYSGQPVTIAQVKFDGYYAEVYKDKDIIFICTKNQKVNLWPKLVKNRAIYKQVLSLPNNTILRCELHAPGVPATSVPTLINEADERLLLSPFCIELWGGGIPNYSKKPIQQFQHFYDLLCEHGFVVPKIKTLKKIFNEPATNIPFPLTKYEIDYLKELAILMGIEGWVLKDDPFLCNCYKIKPQKTVDAFVVNYTISDSDAYAGGLKSVDIAVLDIGYIYKELIIATVGTGFTGDYRMNVDLKSLIGKVGEFKYQTVGAKGRLIMPRFLHWRDDKAKNNCLIEQLKGI